MLKKLTRYKTNLILLKIICLLSIFILALSLPKVSNAALLPKAHYVLVKKKARRLYLMQDDRVIKTYKISLGKSPLGHKVKVGDSKTPVGTYMLDWRNPNSKFYKSIHISYPNKNDLQNAKKLGVNPGGAIMIHGQPNGVKLDVFFKDRDWTDGCIALSNKDMDEIWQSVANNTPITIEE